MARQTVPPQKQAAQITAAEMKAGIDRIEKRIKEVEAFDPRSVTDQYATPDLDALEAAIDETLARTFGAHTLDYDRYKQAKDFNRGPYNYVHTVQSHEFQASIAKSKANSLALLRQAVKSLKERLDEGADHTSAAPETKSKPTLSSRKVFVVHGHDAEARETVARFLSGIEFEPIILHEQANLGRTIIEKVEANAGVGFAVVLLTPDDLGRSKNEGDLEPRPRQNVLLELGYFFAKLGRERVCALKRGIVEVPSDFAGIVWEELDNAGAWKQKLGRELKAVGYEINWNLVMR